MDPLQMAKIENEIRHQNDKIRSLAETLARLPNDLSLRIGRTTLEQISSAATPQARRYPLVGYGILC